MNDHDAVFEVFRAFADELGTLDRVIVNAGLGKGQPIGSAGSLAGPSREPSVEDFTVYCAALD